MTAKTAYGQRARELLDWANEDPDGRASEALEKVGILARSLRLTGTNQRALDEVRDVGGILHKLAGIKPTVVPVVVNPEGE